MRSAVLAVFSLFGLQSKQPARRAFGLLRLWFIGSAWPESSKGGLTKRRGVACGLCGYSPGMLRVVGGRLLKTAGFLVSVLVAGTLILGLIAIAVLWLMFPNGIGPGD